MVPSAAVLLLLRYKSRQLASRASPIRAGRYSSNSHKTKAVSLAVGTLRLVRLSSLGFGSFSCGHQFHRQTKGVRSFRDSRETILKVWSPTAAAGLAPVVTVGLKNIRARARVEWHTTKAAVREAACQCIVLCRTATNSTPQTAWST
jgi:hypothetical protein